MKVNEKFTENSDPIEDMGIGKSRWFNEVRKFFIEEIFGDKKSTDSFMYIARYELERLYQREESPEDAADICFSDISLYNKWDKIRNIKIKESYIMDSLLEGCNCNKKKTPIPLNAPPRPPSRPRPKPTPSRPSVPRHRLHEKFIEDSDPIEDLGIGIIELIKNDLIKTGKMTSYESSRYYFGTNEYDNESFEIFEILVATKMYAKFSPKNIKKIFQNRCKLYSIKGINSNKIIEVFKKRYGIDLNDVNEKFIEDSDPVQDLGIGLIEFWKKQRQEAGARSSTDSSQIYYGTPIYHLEALVVFVTLVEIQKQVTENEKIDVQKAFDFALNWQNRHQQQGKIDVKKVIMALKKFFYINVKYSKIKESVIKTNSSFELKNNEYNMKNLNEESKYDIKKLAKIALVNLPKWVDRQDFEYLNNELNDLQRKNASDEEGIGIFREFLETHIDVFFDIFIKYNNIERMFLEDHKDEIVDNIIEISTNKNQSSKMDPELQLPEEGDEWKKLLKPQQSGPLNYSKMDQYDLKKEVDKALDTNDFDTLRKIQPYVKEGFLKNHVIEFLNENKDNEYLVSKLR